MQEPDASIENLPEYTEIQSFLKEYYTLPPSLNALDTAMEAAPGPPPPSFVPALPVFNVYPQTVGNMNNADDVYIEETPQLKPPPVVPTQPVFNIWPQAVGHLNTANAMYMEAGPAPRMRLMPPPSVYSQAAPSMYSQSFPSVYGQAAASVYSQAAPVFHQSYEQNTMKPGGQMYNQAVVQSQVQYLPYQQQVFNNQMAPLGCGPHKYMQMPMQAQGMNMPVVGVLNGEMVYGITPGTNFTSLARAPAPIKKKKQPKGEDNVPYIRRPPNAFMLFLRERRPNAIAAEKLRSCSTVNSATINALLGREWKSMTKMEQDKYYHEANREREYHCLLHPGWSPGQNYGKKRKRIRTKAPKETEASAYGATEVAKESMNPELLGPPVPPVTASHIFSLNPQSFNLVPPQHHLKPSTHTNDPVVPKQEKITFG